jgi:hypothetical protein
MPELHDPIDTDLVRQLERYGTVVRDDSPVPVPDRPPTLVLDEPSGRARHVAFAAVVVVAVLVAAALVASRDEGAPGGIEVGTTSTLPGVILPAALPHARLAGWVPPDLVPAGVADTDPAADRDQTHASTRQHFLVQDTAGTRHTVTVRIDPDHQTRLGQVPGRWPLRGSVADWGGSPGNNSWLVIDVAEPRSVVNLGTRTLPPEALPPIAEALVGRGDDPLAGFDAPAEPVDGANITLTAERIVARGQEPPANRRVWYRSAGGARQVIVQGQAPDGGTGLDLLIGTTPVERRVIAGAERMVTVTEESGESWVSVAWFDADGSQVRVAARGLNDDELERVVGGVTVAGGDAWREHRARAAADLRTRPILAQVDLPLGRLTAYGEHVQVRTIARPVEVIHGVCLELTGGPHVCDPRVMAGSSAVIPPPVYTGNGSSMPGSLAVDGRWVVFGAETVSGGPLRAEVSTDAGGAPLPAATAQVGGIFVWAVELPATATRAELQISGLLRGQRLVRPRP